MTKDEYKKLWDNRSICLLEKEQQQLNIIIQLFETEIKESISKLKKETNISNVTISNIIYGNVDNKELFFEKLYKHFSDFNIEYISDNYSDDDYSYYKITLK